MLLLPIPASLPAWTEAFCDLPVPVLAGTQRALDALAQAEAERGDVDAHRIAEAVAQDPLMTLRIFASAARLATPAAREDRRGMPETVTAALLLLGIGPFFRSLGELPLAEAAVDPARCGIAGAPEGLATVLRRARRSANFALGFAVHRMDGDAAALQTAALLHDFAELLLWCHRPELADTLARRQAADPTLRSASAQQALLGIELSALEQALMRAWGLPELLRRMTDERQARDPQVRCVSLAVRIARHSTAGWDNAALPDDWTALGELLQLSPEAAEALVRDIDR